MTRPQLAAQAVAQVWRRCDVELALSDDPDAALIERSRLDRQRQTCLRGIHAAPRGYD